MLEIVDLGEVKMDIVFKWDGSEFFLIWDEVLIVVLSVVVKMEIGCDLELLIGGGIFDVWFIKNYCLVVEFGLVG